MNQKSKVIKFLREEIFWPNKGYKIYFRRWIFDRETNKYVGYLKGALIVCLDDEFKRQIENKKVWMNLRKLI